MMRIIGGRKTPDRKAGRNDLHGFDVMDRGRIQPVAGLIEDIKRRASPA